MAVYKICYKKSGNKIFDKVTEMRIDTERGKFLIQELVPNFIVSFEYVQLHSERFAEMQKKKESKARKKRKNVTSRSFFKKTYTRYKISRIDLFPNVPFKNKFENFSNNRN